MTSDIKRFNLHNVFQTANLVGIVWNLDKEIKSRVLYYASCMAYIFHILYKTNYRTIIKENNKLISFLAISSNIIVAVFSNSDLSVPGFTSRTRTISFSPVLIT